MNLALTRNIESISCYTSRALQSYFTSCTVALLVMWPSFTRAEAPQEHAASMEKEHEHEMQSSPTSLSEQIRDLGRQVAELQTKIREQGVDSAAMNTNGDERRLKMSMGTIGGVSQAPLRQPMSAAPSNQMPAANMMAGMMSMMSSMMSGMGGMPGSGPIGPPFGIGGQAVLSSLPGFPGASHLYHIGSTNFFLDHPDHITLSLEQQRRLSEVRMNALMKRSEFNRKIQEGEEQLWLLTAADQPNLSLVEAKIREVEKLRSDLRLTFIRDVGEAATVLTEAQRIALLGQSTPSGQNILPSIGATQSNGAMGDM